VPLTVRLFAATMLLALAAPGHASVSAVSPNGFVSSHRLDLPGVSAVEAYRRFVALPAWWDPAHSYSGKASALSFDPKAGGCWCERLDGGGSVEHMRVLLVQPGKRLVMNGGLGPLLYQGVAATMDVGFADTASGSSVTIHYRVAGFAEGGADKLAGPVDGVLTAGVARYAAYARSSVTKA
jgi:hypothetical protein